MAPKKKPPAAPHLTREWTLPAAATLGSSVRAKGILLEIRAHLPAALKKSIDIRGAVVVLGLPEGGDADFRTVSTVVDKTLNGIESLPVIPREIQDILTISTSERHRWLKDGRLPSAGTRTVKLYGRAKKITFHVFDPRRVEEILDRDLVSEWREDDIITRQENRQRAREAAAFTRLQKKAAQSMPATETGRDEASGQKLQGWDEFAASGLLR